MTALRKTIIRGPQSTLGRNAARIHSAHHDAHPLALRAIWPVSEVQITIRTDQNHDEMIAVLEWMDEHQIFFFFVFGIFVRSSPSHFDLPHTEPSFLNTNYLPFATLRGLA